MHRLLRQTRDTVALVEQSEMEDYLGGRCLIQSVRRASVQQVPPKTALLYPIILPDRLELLLEFPDRIEQHTVSVSAETLRSNAQRLILFLRSHQPGYQSLAQRLHDWILAPLRDSLERQQTHTLPDGHVLQKSCSLRPEQGGSPAAGAIELAAPERSAASLLLVAFHIGGKLAVRRFLY
jgi:CHAT domain-containing protein